MPIDLPVVLVVGLVALVVASVVAQRAGAHADRVAGRRHVVQTDRRGPLGAVADLLDQSVAAYEIRRRLGLSTRTWSQRRTEEAYATRVAQAEAIRQHRSGPPPPGQPTHLVVSGHAAGAVPMRRPSTLRSELVIAAVGLLVVIGLVIAIAPRGSGGVLSATGVPGRATDPRPTPTASPTPVPEAVAS
jgi:hypothetical protein